MDSANFFSSTMLGVSGRLLAGLWGALWGSFFCLVIVRLPAEESIVRPSSHCRNCHAPIAWYDNIPLLSYLLLGGRCRQCKAHFSCRYFIVELLVCGLALALHQVYVVGGTAAIELRLAQFVITSLFCGILVTVAFIDFDTLRIPDVITYPGIPIAALLSLFMGHLHLWDGLVGALAGYLVIRLIADGYQFFTGRMGMGYGDAKLLAMIGGLLGWQVLLPVLFLASFQGTVIGISVLVKTRGRRKDTLPRGSNELDADQQPLADIADETRPKENEEEELPAESLRYARIPFGPFLSLAAIELLLLKDFLLFMFPFG